MVPAHPSSFLQYTEKLLLCVCVCLGVCVCLVEMGASELMVRGEAGKGWCCPILKEMGKGEQAGSFAKAPSDSSGGGSISFQRSTGL